jgi:hypothetical protein
MEGIKVIRVGKEAGETAPEIVDYFLKNR